MNINFNLARPAADISPVRLVITHRGKVYRKSTGLSVRTARWNARRQMSGDLSLKFSLSITFYVTNTYLLLSTK